MPRNRTELEKLAGKLISSIQKVWGEQSGEEQAEISEEVMYKGHDLLQAGSIENMNSLLGSLSVSEYLGEEWLQSQPQIMEQVKRIESLRK